MKKKEIKKLSKSELSKNIDKLKKDLFNFRFQKISSQITSPAKINETPPKVKATGNPRSRLTQITTNKISGINSIIIKISQNRSQTLKDQDHRKNQNTTFV